MSQPTALAELTERFEQATAELRIPMDELGGVPHGLADAIAGAGFQSSIGTIAFAGQYATGSYAVQYNDQNGGFSSVWPQWAFELAKTALVAGKRVWVGSNGDPFGSNLVFVLIMP